MSQIPTASIVRRPRAPRSNLWPGLTADTAEQFVRIGRGLPISRPNEFAQKHERYYHVVDYPVGGGTKFTFFNAALQDHVTNVQNGTIPDDRPFWLTGVCITPQDLTALASGSPSVTRSGVQLSGSAITAYARAEEIRTILQAGLLRVIIGDRKVLEVQDLTHFPSDGGAYVSAAMITFASATASSAAPLNNGSPIAGNRFRLPAPWPVLPGKGISATIEFQQALTITTAMRIKVELVGESIIALNS